MSANKQTRTKYEFKSFESRSKNTKRYCRITKDMQESPAWLDLSPFAITVYLMLKTKYNLGNADNLSLTYKEGLKHMCQTRFTKSVDELIDHGFIYLVRQAWTSRECNLYGLSAEWQKWGTEEFKVISRSKRDSKSTNRLKI